MKKILFLISFLISCTSMAAGFWEATGEFLQKYGLPCAVGVATGYAIDHDKGPQYGAVGCVMIFTYGEFGKGSNRTLTNEDLQLVSEMMMKMNSNLNTKIHSEYDSRLDLFNLRLSEETNISRAQIRSTVTDLGVFLDKDLTEKMSYKLESGDFLKNWEAKLTDRIKEEIQAEYRSRESEIIRKTTDKVITRVVAEPIVIEERRAAPARTKEVVAPAANDVLPPIEPQQ